MTDKRILATAALALGLLASSPLAQAQGNETTAATAAAPTMCSCSPTVFTFTLNLDGSCEINDIEDNPGIDGSFCFVEDGVTVPAPPLTDTIVDIAAGNEDFSTLVAAVTAAGLADALSGEGPITVFAPTNEAFAALPEGTVESLLLPENVDQLTSILTYHVVAAEALSTDLVSGPVETLNGATVEVVVGEDGSVTVGGATVVTADIMASNGVIHVIDAVLLPPANLPEPDAEAEEEATICAFCADGMPDPEMMIPTGDNVTCAQASGYAATLAPGDSMCATTQLAQAVCCPAAAATEENVRRKLSTTRRRAARRHARKAVNRRRLQETTAEEADPNAIVEIVSVQFLEFDTSGDLTVINQDDTYADVSLADGDRIKFMSASSFLDTSLPLEEQMSSPALVPGGASIIMYGKTASGDVVRNRFFWMYDMNCGRENNPVMVGDDIGWVTVAETSNAWPVFCPALPDGSPTIAPRTNEPTLSPSVSPIKSPTQSPAMSMQTAAPTPRTSVITPKPNGYGGGDKPVFGKSSKAPKTPKPSKSGKSKSAKAKSSKSTKGSKGSSVDGKTGKDETGYTNYNMEKLTGYDVSRNGAESMYSSGFLMMVSLVASALLMVRQ